MIVELSKTQTANTDNRVNQSKFKANTRNRFAKGNYKVWENTCDQVTVGDHCSAETRVADHGKHRKSREPIRIQRKYRLPETSAGEKRGRPTYDRWSLVWSYFGLTKKMARTFLADSTAQQCTIREIVKSLLTSRFRIPLRSNIFFIYSSPLPSC